MGVFPFFFVLAAIQVFGESEAYLFRRSTAKIKSMGGTKTGPPVVSISDDNSIRLQVYQPQKPNLFKCRQVVSIEHRRGQAYVELDTVTISCANIPKLLRILTKDFINFGDAIFLGFKEGKVTALFAMPTGLCTQRTYSNGHNAVEETTEKINPTECRKILNIISPSSLPQTKPNALLLITPEPTEESETVEPIYLSTKVSPPAASIVNGEETPALKTGSSEPQHGPAIDNIPLILYSLDPSPPGRSVYLIMHALGLPVEQKAVNLFQKEHLSPEYAKLNPLRTIPAIEDNGFVLWESHAIMTYLVAKYGNDDSLYPKELKKRAIVDQRLHYSNDVFYVQKQITKLVVFLGVKTVPDELVAKVREHQENVEKLLVGNTFIAGDSLSVADYSFVTLMDILEIYSPTEDKYPLTKAWFERCKSSMKDFNNANEKGAEQMKSTIKKALAG